MAPTKRAQVRIRSVHPNLLTSRRFSDLSSDAEVLFVRLQMACDDEGRCLAEPLLLKAWLFPLRERVTPALIVEWLEELEAAELVTGYVVEDGRELVQVLDWDDFQRPRRRAESDLPPPPVSPGQGAGADIVRPGPADGGSESADVRPGEGEGEGCVARDALPLPRPFTVTEEMRAWATSRAVNVEHETAKFAAHYRANGEKRRDWVECWRKWILGAVERFS